VAQKKHPAQTPDLAPKYFHLIQAMKQNLSDHTHKDERGVEKCGTRWLIKHNQTGIYLMFVGPCIIVVTEE